MVKKDKKSKASEKKARVAQKQDKKAAQKEKKSKAKGSKLDDSDAEDVDLDEVLAEYARKQEQFLKVTEEVCEPPSARTSSTFIASPSNDNELFIYGGEYFNGALASFYNDLFVYNINRDEWKVVTSPNSPLPRSGHAWCRGGNAGGIYLFGGEFSSPKQGTFYHYNDFWRLDPGTREWSRIETKGKGPPARSGHRMTYFKNYIILFGGFQDTSQQTKYLQDVWIYDCQAFSWHSPSLPPASGKPDARSSMSLLPHDSGAVLFGGYSRVKVSEAVSKQTKGSNRAALKTFYKPIVHQDSWLLRIVPPGSDAPANALPKVHWERRKKPANPPNPHRAGTTMVYHKGRGLLFGGVYDVEQSEEGIDSEFFNNLFAWNIDRNRFYQLTLRRPRAQSKKQAPNVDRGRRGRGRADEEELLRNLAVLEMHGRIEGADDGDLEVLKQGDDGHEDSEAEKPQKIVAFEMPHPRFNAQLAVQGDVMYIFGGTFEKGDREYTFDEMHAIELGKLDGVTEIYRRELEDWHGSEDEDSEEEESDDSFDDDEEEGDEQDNASTAATSVSQPLPSPERSENEHIPTEDSTVGELPSNSADALPHPRPFESLSAFYTRTSIQWQEVVIEQLRQIPAGEANSVKEVRKLAFERAESIWWDCREEIAALEDEQEQAGIGEIVNIAARSGEGGAVGRRR